ncbi:714_t:CDS:1, partial [Scutellospora calospora]
ADTRSRINALELPILLFELYYDYNEEPNNHSVIKKIFPFSSKRRMVMEIKPYVRDEQYGKNKNLFRRNTAISGVSLGQILDAWTNPQVSRHHQNPRSDYE